MSRILVTGATGKVGSEFVRRILNEPAHESTIIRALCHNRQPEPHARVEVVTRKHQRTRRGAPGHAGRNACRPLCDLQRN